MPGLAEILDENQRLRVALAARELELSARDDELNRQRALLAERDAMLEAVKASAELMAQQLDFLQRKPTLPASQRYIPDEQEVLPFGGDVVAPPRAPVVDDDDDKPAQKRKRRGTPKRRTREDFAHLPARSVTCPVDPDATCAGCGGALQVFGVAHSIRIDWVPGHFERHDIVRDKCRCPQCPQQGVLTVPAPYALDRALCGNSLLSRVLIDKFADHIPLHRQARRMGREGFAVGSNTLSSWVCNAASLLAPLARAVRQGLLSASYLQGDDTGFPVQDQGNGSLRKGRLWAFTDSEHVFYAFTASKRGEFPAQILDGYKGELLLVDGGSEFNEVVRSRSLHRAGCWSHLRTYFFDALRYHPVEAGQALGTIRDVFMLERAFRGMSLAQLLDARTQHTRPLVDGFFAWVKALVPRIRPGSMLGSAIGYAVSQEQAMRMFLDYPDLPVHNNLSELMLRQAVVGRKNWLFARSDGGAEAAATLYTLIGSCFLQGIDPHAYLVDVLKRLPDHPSSRVVDLTPRMWRLERQRHADAAG